MHDWGISLGLGVVVLVAVLINWFIDRRDSPKMSIPQLAIFWISASPTLRLSATSTRSRQIRFIVDDPTLHDIARDRIRINRRQDLASRDWRSSTRTLLCDVVHGCPIAANETRGFLWLIATDESLHAKERLCFSHCRNGGIRWQHVFAAAMQPDGAHARTNGTALPGRVIALPLPGNAVLSRISCSRGACRVEPPQVAYSPNHAWHDRQTGPCGAPH